MSDVSSRAYIGLLAKIANSFLLWILLTLLWTTLIVSIQQFQQLQEVSTENVQSAIPLILVTILERNLIPLHRLQVIVKLLTGQHILQFILLHWPYFYIKYWHIRDSGIEKSLSSSCHHDIIYGKINFRVPLPPPHFRTVWNCKNADTISIQPVVENFNGNMHLKEKRLMKRYKFLVKF